MYNPPIGSIIRNISLPVRYSAPEVRPNRLFCIKHDQFSLLHFSPALTEPITRPIDDTFTIFVIPRCGLQESLSQIRKRFQGAAVLRAMNSLPSFSPSFRIMRYRTASLHFDSNSFLL